MRTLEHRTNNAYDTILLVEDSAVIGAWDAAREDAMKNFREPGDLNDWAHTNPDATDPADYGELVERKTMTTTADRC